jgi:hypothetical protein
MTLIDEVVSRAFGYGMEKYDINSVEYMKQSIKNAPGVIEKYSEYTPDEAIKDALFEYTDIAKYLKNLKEKNDGNQEQDS